jgi:hypothetical protein
MTDAPTIHQLQACDGQRSAAAPNIGILTHPRHRPTLYILIETAGAADAESLSAWLVSACAQAYQQTHSSLTGALLDVVRAADTALKQERASAAVTCGLTALLINKDEALLAQIEPAVCWVLREGQLTRLPKESVWLDPTLDERVVHHLRGGLGNEETAQPELTRIPLDAGERLLVANSALARQVGEAVIAGALAQDDPTAALHELAPAANFAAFSVTPHLSAATVPHAAAIPTREQTHAPTHATPSPLKLKPPISRPPSNPTAETTLNQQEAEAVSLSSFFSALVSSLSAVRPYLAVVGMAIGLLLKLLWGLAISVIGLLSRALPAHEPKPQPRVSQVRRPVMQANPMESRLLFWIALGIPIIVLLGVFFMRQQAAATQANRAAELLMRAAQTYEAGRALPANEKDKQKAEFVKAQQLLDEALLLAPRDKTTQELQTKITSALDRLNNVVKFFFYPMLYDFKEPDSRPTKVVARGIDVYVLDMGLHRLYKFLLNETRDHIQPITNTNPIVMRQGDERGAIVIGRMTDVFWATTGGGRSSVGLLTLTASKQVVEYAPTRGINVLTLGATTGWQEATLADSFNGNVYVLDAKSNRIVKYAPTGDDYKNAPTDYVTPGEQVDFAGATDMAIDGAIYVLLADGTLLKFEGGHLVPFELKGLDMPLRKPVTIVAPVNSQSIYVADAGNKRIVQFNKQGEFQRQLKPDDPTVMSDLRGLAVDEASKRFYFVNGNKLYLGTLQN